MTGLEGSSVCLLLNVSKRLNVKGAWVPYAKAHAATRRTADDWWLAAVMASYDSPDRIIRGFIRGVSRSGGTSRRSYRRRIRSAPPTANTAAKMRNGRKASPRKTTPIKAANRTPVSRSAATKAIGATVMAQMAMP
jgi:hypothetical protein